MRRGRGKAVRDLDRGRLLAAYPVSVSIEVRAVAGLTSANGRRAGSSRSRAVGKRMSTATARQGPGCSARTRASCVVPASMAVVTAVFSVVVAALRVQPSRMGNRGCGQNDYRCDQREVQTIHVDPPRAHFRWPEGVDGVQRARCLRALWNDGSRWHRRVESPISSARTQLVSAERGGP